MFNQFPQFFQIFYFISFLLDFKGDNLKIVFAICGILISQ